MEDSERPIGSTQVGRRDLAAEDEPAAARLSLVEGLSGRMGILTELELLDHKDIVLIDARNDNKPSGSKAVA